MYHLHLKLLFCLGMSCLWANDTVGQATWSQFRGDRADGVAADNNKLPITWNTSENVSWIANVPGWGWSCPIVWGDRVYLTTVIADEENLTPSKGLYLGQGVRTPAKGVHHWMVYCFDLNTGEEIWKQQSHVGQPKVPRHPKSTYAAETAATDGERVYALFGDLGLFCYDMDGKPLWSQKIAPKKTLMDYGAAASPVVHDGQVFVVYDNREESWIASFDAKTGAENWKKKRNETHSWATPFVWKNDLRTEIVVPGKNRNRSYALDGELLWEFDGQMSSLVIPSPFAAHGMCYIASGYVGDKHRPTFAIKPGAKGEITPKGDFTDSEYIQWYQATSSSYNPTQTVHGDYLYTLYDQGFLTCHNAKTGEQIYGKKRFSPGGSFTASPIAYNGHIFCLNEDGLTYVVKAGPEFEIVARNELDELCIACPAAIGDKLLIRTASRLYCLTEGAKLDPATTAGLEPKRQATGAMPVADLWAAATTGNIKQIRRLLTAGKDVNAQQRGSKNTALINTAIHGRDDAMQLLLNRDANVSLQNSDGNTALLIAAFFCRTDQVKMLLDAGASPNIKNKRGETAIDVVSGAWDENLANLYEGIGNAIGADLDLKRIEQTRPIIKKLLSKQAPDNNSLGELETLKAAIDSGIADGKVAGAMHLVWQDDKEVFFHVAGKRDIQDAKPMQRDTIVRMYSMTKAITSLAAMKLFEQGKFQLDDPVAKFIPEFANAKVIEKDGDGFNTVDASRPINIRDVMTHTTGYAYGGNGIKKLEAMYRENGLKYRDPKGTLPPTMTIEEAAKRLAKIPALHHPGKKFTYGFSTDLLGRLVEVWSGERLDKFMRREVFEPLEMVDTDFAVPKSKADRFASLHTTAFGKLAIVDKSSTSPYLDGFEFLSGGGGLVSTIDDYAKFCQVMVNQGKFDDTQILKPSTIKLMLSDQLPDVPGNFQFGLGFAIREIKIGKGDSAKPAMEYRWGGYASTEFRLVPEQRLFQIFVRQHVPTKQGLANQQISAAYELLRP